MKFRSKLIKNKCIYEKKERKIKQLFYK